VSTGVELGVGLALIAAAGTNLASLLKHRGCKGAHRINIAEPLQTARSLARSRWFAAGWLVAAVAWLAHMAALSMAPISLVQSVLAGGAVFVAVMAQRMFGHRVERRQWVGLALGGGGLALLVLTLPRLQDSHSEFSLAAMLGFEGGLVALAAGFAWGHRNDFDAERDGVLLAASAGALFALGGIALKGLIGAGGTSAALLVPWLALTIATGVLAQFAAAAALQRGEAVAVIGLMGLVANAAQIAGGVLVFGDPLSSSAAGIVLQGLAFVMVCGSALLMPAQRRLAAAA
jgi:drug/metabolite transporter (DMT)-like permease